MSLKTDLGVVVVCICSTYSQVTTTGERFRRAKAINYDSVYSE